MAVEPQYGLPVERPGDVEGWSINSGQPGDLLAEAVAVETQRIEAAITAFQTRIDALPRTIQTGNVRLPREVFQAVTDDPFYNSNYLRGSEAIIFDRPFDDTPAVVVIPNNNILPGFAIEQTVSNVSTSGFTVRLAVSGSFTGTFVSRWIAAERTQ